MSEAGNSRGWSPPRLQNSASRDQLATPSPLPFVPTASSQMLRLHGRNISRPRPNEATTACASGASSCAGDEIVDAISSSAEVSVAGRRGGGSGSLVRASSANAVQRRAVGGGASNGTLELAMTASSCMPEDRSPAQDERFQFLCDNANVELIEGQNKFILAELPYLPGVLVAYRSAACRNQSPERLHLDRRRLKKCPVLEGEERLRLLNYQNNNITRIENLSCLPNLVFLDLYDNRIQRIENLDPVKNLRVLMLGKNQLRKIENLEGLKKLDVLDLHSNTIEDIENLSHLQELRVLNLAGNCIIEARNMHGLRSLTELNLRRNELSTVAGLEDLINLQRLFASHNRVAILDGVLPLQRLSTLTELALDGNAVCSSPEYRWHVVSCCRSLENLDGQEVTAECRRRAAALREVQAAAVANPVSMSASCGDKATKDRTAAATIGAAAAASAAREALEELAGVMREETLSCPPATTSEGNDSQSEKVMNCAGPKHGEGPTIPVGGTPHEKVRDVVAPRPVAVTAVSMSSSHQPEDATDIDNDDEKCASATSTLRPARDEAEAEVIEASAPSRPPLRLPAACSRVATKDTDKYGENIENVGSIIGAMGKSSDADVTGGCSGSACRSGSISKITRNSAAGQDQGGIVVTAPSTSPTTCVSRAGDYKEGAGPRSESGRNSAAASGGNGRSGQKIFTSQDVLREIRSQWTKALAERRTPSSRYGYVRREQAGSLAVYGRGLDALDKPEYQSMVNSIHFNFVTVEAILQDGAARLKRFQNLTMLRFSNNLIFTIHQLESLRHLPLLRSLTIDDNQVIERRGALAIHVVHLLPQIEVLNGHQIRASQRDAAARLFSVLDEAASQENSLHYSPPRRGQRQGADLDHVASMVDSLVSHACSVDAKLCAVHDCFEEAVRNLIFEAWDDIVSLEAEC